MISYSSDGEFFDADEGEDGHQSFGQTRNSKTGGEISSLTVGSHSNSGTSRQMSKDNRSSTQRTASDEPNWGDAGEDFDAIYNNSQERDVGDINKQHGSVLMHLLSQVYELKTNILWFFNSI